MLAMMWLNDSDYEVYYDCIFYWANKVKNLFSLCLVMWTKSFGNHFYTNKVLTTSFYGYNLRQYFSVLNASSSLKL